MSERQNERSPCPGNARAEAVPAIIGRQAGVLVVDVAFNIFGGALSTTARHATRFDRHTGLLQDGKRRLMLTDSQAHI